MFKFFSENIQTNFYFNSSLLLERSSNCSLGISPNSSLIRSTGGGQIFITNNNFI